MGGPNLEVFKFGMYIMFPIGWMYYFGTNLENRFSVPDFWPKPEATYKIPFERDEIERELERQKQKRLLRRDQRLQHENFAGDDTSGSDSKSTGAALSSLYKAWELLDREGHDGQQRRIIRQTNYIERS